jgi:putative ABC transport system permease protein
MVYTGFFRAEDDMDWTGGFLHDIRYAARLARRQPRHALLIIGMTALGIGATTALFGVAYGVLWKPLPWPHADRVVVLKETRGGNPPRFGAFSNAAYLAWREQPATVEHIAAWSQRVVTLSGDTAPERIRITAATASLFPALGVRPLIGSLFEERDDTSAVMLLSESLWRQRFSGDPGAIGTIVQLDGRPHTIVGVLPDAMSYPDRQARAIVPFTVPSASANQLSVFNAIATLRPGISAAQAAAEGTARGRFAADTGMTAQAVFGSDGPIEIAAQPVTAALTADVRLPLIVLLAAVGLLLVTATANVASLQLARATTRGREMAIRAALGAGSPRVTRQLLAESLLLGIAGGLLGVALTVALQRSLPSMLPGDFPRVDDLGINAAVIAFALILTLGTSLAFGLLPVLNLRKSNLVEALAGEGTAPAGAGIQARTARVRMAIMTAQVAIACVLLVGASLLGRSFIALLGADRGFDPGDVLSARLTMPEALYPSQERRFALIDEILNRIRTLPGVTDASFTSELPLTRGGSTAAFTMKSPAAEGGVVTAQASPRIVSSGYFSTLQMRAVAGRTFTDADIESVERVVVVNQSFARRYLGDSWVGSKLPVAGYATRDDDNRTATVIGVLDDVRYVSAQDQTSQPEMFYSYRQMDGRLPVQTVTLLVRASGDPAAIAGQLQSVIRRTDERLVADVILPLEQRLLTTLARPRLYSVLLGSFAGFALLTATIGLFGLLSYAVSQRSRELALRAALGADRNSILRLMLRQGLAVVIAGLGAGMLASIWLTGFLSTQLYGVAPHDAFTFIAVPVLLLAVGALACMLPAWRAATVDPVRILRGA